MSCLEYFNKLPDNFILELTKKCKKHKINNIKFLQIIELFNNYQVIERTNDNELYYTTPEELLSDIHNILPNYYDHYEIIKNVLEKYIIISIEKNKIFKQIETIIKNLKNKREYVEQENTSNNDI